MTIFKYKKQAEICPKCQSVLQIKKGKTGLFLGCSQYPSCDYIKPLKAQAHIIKDLPDLCPQCHAYLQLKQGSFGMFIGCSQYPECDFTVHQETQTAPLNITCPECKTHQLAPRHSRTGKTFYGCEGFPKCKFTLPSEPIEITCPACQFPLAYAKKSRGKTAIICANKHCQHLIRIQENQ